MLAKLISALMALTAIAELAFYAFKSHSLNFIFEPALSNVGRVDYFIDLQVVTLNGASCQVPLAMIYEKSCYFNQTNIPRLFIFGSTYWAWQGKHVVPWLWSWCIGHCDGLSGVCPLS
jgi:hypothetical protein